MQTTLTFELTTQPEIVLAANFQIALINMRLQAAAEAEALARGAQGFSCGNQTGPAVVTETKPTVETTTGPLTDEAATSAPALVVTDLSDEALTPLFRAYITKVGTPAARALLDKYTATRLQDVKPEDRAAFAAEISA